MTTSACTVGSRRPVDLALRTPTPNGPDGWPKVEPLLARLAALKPSDPNRSRLRHHIICQCVNAARREANRYRHSGETNEDLAQVAILGLILAVDRYDPARNVGFKHFALPTITGELKRHFRDKSWSVKVSRRVQELHQRVRKAEPELAQRLGRMPTAADLAGHLRLCEEDVDTARVGDAAYTARSLSWPYAGEDDRRELGESFGAPDPAIEAVVEHDALSRALPLLPERLRCILSLRYVDELSQSQIAEKVGMSQMHVSRLLSRSITMLRQHMTAEEPTALSA